MDVFDFLLFAALSEAMPGAPSPAGTYPLVFNGTPVVFNGVPLVVTI